MKVEVLADVSANAIGAKDEAGRQVIVFFIQSDTLFATGAATLSGPARDTLDGLARTSPGNGRRPPSRYVVTPTRPGPWQ